LAGFAAGYGADEYVGLGQTVLFAEDAGSIAIEIEHRDRL
jgi:hypothetical protein